MRHILFFAFLGFQLSVQAQRLILEQRGCKVSEGSMEEILRITKYQAKLYNNLFNTSANDTLQIFVNLYGSRQEYNFVQKLAMSNGHKTLGFYSPSQNQAHVYRGSDYSPVIIHEASHSFLQYNLPFHSRWLTEGIAEFCETLEVQQNEVVFSAQSQRIKLVQNLIEKKGFNLALFLNTPNSSWGEKEKTQDLYSISYSLIYFLIKKKPNALKQILLFIKEGQSEKQAIEYGYGGFHQFENDYISFYKKLVVKPV